MQLEWPRCDSQMDPREHQTADDFKVALFRLLGVFFLFLTP